MGRWRHACVPNTLSSLSARSLHSALVFDCFFNHCLCYLFLVHVTLHDSVFLKELCMSWTEQVCAIYYCPKRSCVSQRAFVWAFYLLAVSSFLEHIPSTSDGSFFCWARDVGFLVSRREWLQSWTASFFAASVAGRRHKQSLSFLM